MPNSNSSYGYVTSVVYSPGLRQATGHIYSLPSLPSSVWKVSSPTGPRPVWCVEKKPRLSGYGREKNWTNDWGVELVDVTMVKEKGGWFLRQGVCLLGESCREVMLKTAHVHGYKKGCDINGTGSGSVSINGRQLVIPLIVLVPPDDEGPRQRRPSRPLISPCRHLLRPEDARKPRRHYISRASPRGTSAYSKNSKSLCNKLKLNENLAIEGDVETTHFRKRSVAVHKTPSGWIRKCRSWDVKKEVTQDCVDNGSEKVTQLDISTPFKGLPDPHFSLPEVFHHRRSFVPNGERTSPRSPSPIRNLNVKTVIRLPAARRSRVICLPSSTITSPDVKRSPTYGLKTLVLSGVKKYKPHDTRCTFMLWVNMASATWYKPGKIKECLVWYDWPRG